MGEALGAVYHTLTPPPSLSLVAFSRRLLKRRQDAVLLESPERLFGKWASVALTLRLSPRGASGCLRWVAGSRSSWCFYKCAWVRLSSFRGRSVLYCVDAFYNVSVLWG